eukprot:CAMPEP_0197720528 /NCGR_PEP_ID=MMETSP1434-20131217/3871_1 /TAXON_ID=265543 /ORGANISM="Minutocellus polymorphus, Strain CCMP3303" /LENGTH=497 /DNA_ID=CAMNT_0043305403 /DNA_START=1 /DNA_END=1491 /DNA_ORIENTATION=-
MRSPAFYTYMYASFLFAAFAVDCAVAFSLPPSIPASFCSDHRPKSLSYESRAATCTLRAVSEDNDINFVQFDKDGNLTDTSESQRVLEKLCKGSYTDVHIFSHGWNMQTEDAKNLYKEWVDKYKALLKRRPMPAPYKPLLVGITWPSIINLEDLYCWPRRGTILGSSKQFVANAKEELVPALIPYLSDKSEIQDFINLCNQDKMSPNDVLRFFDMMSSLASENDEALEKEDSLTPESIAKAFADSSLYPIVGSPANSTRATFRRRFLGRIKIPTPLLLIRLHSFWLMRKRASKVGEDGVHKLLLQILEEAPRSVRVHLCGHSFGAGVMLSAVSKQPVKKWPKNIDTMFLMQPAVVCSGFVKGGEYRPAIDRTNMPIVSTFSKKDFPLRWAFHQALALNNGEKDQQKNHQNPSTKNDDSKVNDDFDEEALPSFFLKYAALGGYPPIKEPIDMGKDLTISAPSDHLGSDFSFPKKGLCAIRMHKEIEGHGDINNPYVHW